jgi:Kef-type K+ transport system membrane component KefB
MADNPVVALMLALGIIILGSRVGGTLARRFDQPRVLGELLIGVILGPTLLDILHSSALGLEAAHLDETIIELAEIGVLLLMFQIGLGVHLSELAKVGRVAGIAGILGALVPVVLTMPLVLAFNYSWQPALFAGVILAATSVSISAQVLLELGVLQTKEGNALLATALIDDVIAILLVSLTVALTASGGQVDPAALLGIVLRMGVYIIVAFLLAWFVLPPLMNWLNTIPDIARSYGIPTIGLILAFLFGWSAQAIGGVATITGAFIAGVGLSRLHGPIKSQLETAVNNIAYVFLVPIFFVSVGLQVDLSQFPLDALPLATLILILAIVSKVVGCGLGARWGGFTPEESFRLGICMVSRGEVGLIIAALGVSSGVLSPDQPLFASLFLVILLTTVVTPPLVRRVFVNSTARES